MIPIPETNSIDALLEEGKALSATLEYKRGELASTVEQVRAEKSGEINAAEQQLFTHYRNALPSLVEEAVRLMKEVSETPFELRLLVRDDGMYEDTHQYSRFSLLKNSDGTLVYTPETIHWREGGRTWDEFRKAITSQKVLDSEETKPEDIVKMYETLKGFVTQFREK